MKKLLILTFLVFLSIAVFSQRKYEFGVKGGLNITTQTTKGESINVNSNYKAGYNAGVFGNFFFNKRMAGQLEIMISQKGSKWNDPYFTGKDNLCYIDIPLLFRFQIIDLISVHAGPQFSFMTRANSIPDSGDKWDAKSYYNNGDFGIAVGAEVHLPLRLSVVVRYIEGLSVTTNETYYVDKWKNRVFQVSVTFTIISKSLDQSGS